MMSIRCLARTSLITLCLCLKLLCGFLFGAMIWQFMIHPYEKYYDFTRGSRLPQLVFCLGVAFLYMALLKARTVMVLFIPSLVGNASQNFLIVLLFIALFSNPLNNIGSNAIEAARVIGCSLTMTYETLKEKAHLMMNPVLEALKDTDKSNLAPIRQDLAQVHKIVVEMRRQAELKLSDKPFYDNSSFMEPLVQADVKDIAKDIGKRMGMESPDKAMNLAGKMKELIADTAIKLDNGSVKASVDTAKLSELIQFKLEASGPMSQFNLTQIMYENCLSIFQRAKLTCQDAVEDMRKSCQNTIGSFLAAVFCSPIMLTMSSICPWLMNQIIDESNICGQMRSSISKLRIDPFNITKGSDITETYANLTKQLSELADSGFEDPIESQTDRKNHKRLEVKISLNEKTRKLLFTAKEFYDFIRDKYRLRKFFLDILSFIYDFYTTITLITILIKAESYRRSYLSLIKFDNTYITGMFRSIDDRRKALGKPTVLPLTIEESNDYITTLTCKRRTHEELASQRASRTPVILFLAFTLTLFYLDNIFYSILSSIHEHSLISYRDVGHHELDVEIIGEGSVARLVRHLSPRLSSNYSLDRRTNTSRCLPEAIKTGNKFYYEYMYLVALYLLIDQISIYAMRLRRLTCAFFYPNKEKQRIVYLYNLILVRRRELARSGLQSFIEDDETEETIGRTKSNLDQVFTLRDAMRYLADCICQSACCRRHPSRAHGTTRDNRRKVRPN